MVSVICTNYNKGDWIKSALESFLKQKTNFEFEIIIIDDASTDNSVEIIKQLAKDNSKIRLFFNKKNLGIAKTWIKICKEARGKYIARCDGDDFWTDEHKLQKQVDLLEKSKDSKWCNSDFSAINEKGDLIRENCFKNNFVSMPTSFTEMLISKGFTNPSTWVVETKLMQEINKIIDPETADDTFNIQLELFSRTKLTFLPDNTACYRINQGSDSRPTNFLKLKDRNDNLLKTQLHYLQKYRKLVDDDLAIKQLLQDSTLLNNLLAELNIAVQEREYLLSERQKFMDEQSAIISEKEQIIDERDELIKNQKIVIKKINDKRWFGLYKFVKTEEEKEQ